MTERFSDEEIAAFLVGEAERQKHRLDIVVPQGNEIRSTEGDLWARLHDTERTVAELRSRVSWALGLVLALGVALGVTELSLAIHSLSSH